MDKTETKETEGETMLNKAITFRRIISNGNYSCVGIPYSDALKVVNQLRSELQKAKEEIANHIATNSLLLDSDGEADLANKIYQLTTELSKAKELNGELVKAVKEMKAQIQSLGYYPECLSHELEALIKKSEI